MDPGFVQICHVSVSADHTGFSLYLLTMKLNVSSFERSAWVIGIFNIMNSHREDQPWAGSHLP